MLRMFFNLWRYCEIIGRRQRTAKPLPSIVLHHARHAGQNAKRGLLNLERQDRARLGPYDISSYSHNYICEAANKRRRARGTLRSMSARLQQLTSTTKMFCLDAADCAHNLLMFL